MMTDRRKASATSYLGNSEVPSPFMDAIAAKGIAFTHAYAPSPICTPSRLSVHTGVHPLVHQVYCHQNRAPHNLPQLAELLSDNGYFTAVCGHYEQKRNPGRGWHESASYQDRGPLARSLQVQYDMGRQDVGWSYGTIPCSATEGNSALVADRTIFMLDEIQRPGRPFFLHTCFNDPHPPYFVPEPYSRIVDPTHLPLPLQGGDRAGHRGR